MRKTIVDAIVQKALRNQRRERYDVTDIQQPGLVLRVTENAASWVARSNVGKKNRRITIGPVRQIDLATARRITQAVHDTLRSGREVDDAWLDMRLVEAGIREPHPAPDEPQPVQDPAPTTWTWEEAVDNYLVDNRESWRDATYRSYRSILTSPHMVPVHGRLVADIKRREVAALVKAVHRTGIERQSEMIADAIRPMWTYLEGDTQIEKSGVEEGEMAGLRHQRRSLGKVSTTLTKTPEIDQIGRLVAICRTDILHPSYAAALEICAFTAQRRLTVASAAVSHFILDTALWDIDSTHIKGGLPHVMPLSERVVDVVRAALGRTSNNLLFSQIRPARGQPLDEMQHISPDNLSHTVLDLPGMDVGLHSIRRSFATVINFEQKRHWNPALVLDHIEGRKTVTAVAYNRYEYLPEKREMLEFWAETVERAAVAASRDLDVDEVRQGLKAAVQKRNRKRRAARAAKVEEAKAAAAAAKAPDDYMNIIDIIEEWASGGLSSLDAKAMANVASVADLKEFAIDFGIDVRRR